jgi:hypothetical protein
MVEGCQFDSIDEDKRVFKHTRDYAEFSDAFDGERKSILDCLTGLEKHILEIASRDQPYVIEQLAYTTSGQIPNETEYQDSVKN